MKGTGKEESLVCLANCIANGLQRNEVQQFEELKCKWIFINHPYLMSFLTPSSSIVLCGHHGVIVSLNRFWQALGIEIERRGLECSESNSQIYWRGKVRIWNDFNWRWDLLIFSWKSLHWRLFSYWDAIKCDIRNFIWRDDLSFSNALRSNGVFRTIWKTQRQLW